MYSTILYGVILLLGFVYWESRAKQPLLPLSIFADRNFSVTNLAGVSLSFALAGLFIPLSIFLESILNFSAVRAGLTLVPMSLALLVAAPFAGRLADRINGKYIIMFGLFVSTAGIVLLVNALGLGISSWSLAFPLAVIGFGMGSTFAPLTTLSLRDIQPNLAGVASGVFTTTRQVGMAIGSAVVGAVLANSVAHNLPVQASHVVKRLPAQMQVPFLHIVTVSSHSSESFGTGQQRKVPPIPGAPLQAIRMMGGLLKYVFDHAFLDALRPSLLACAAALLLAALTATLLRGGRSAHDARRSEETPAGLEVAS